MIPFACDSFGTFVRIAIAICFQAPRADTTSAGVEGPGSMAPLKHVRPGGPGHHGSHLPVVHTTGKGYASSSGLWINIHRWSPRGYELKDVMFYPR